MALMPVPVAATGATPGFPEIVWIPGTLHQGALMRLEISFPNEAESVSGNFLGHELHLYREKDRKNQWVGFIGIDLDQKPGPQHITIRTGEDVFTSKVMINEKDYGARRFEIREGKSGSKNVGAHPGRKRASECHCGPVSIPNDFGENPFLDRFRGK